MTVPTRSKSTTNLLTLDDLLAMPDNGVERWLTRGHLRERPETLCDRFHARIMAVVVHTLSKWRDEQVVSRGIILCGGAGVHLESDPDTAANIDVVYLSPELAARQAADAQFVKGIPSLVVEILSLNDTQKDIDEKTDQYLSVGVPHVWIIDPHDQTVLVHRPGELPRLFTIRDELTAEPQMPRLRLAVSRIFE